MGNLSSAKDLFPFIGAAHPFYAPIQNLKKQLVTTSLYQETSRKSCAGAEIEARISMKAHPKPASSWALKEFCVFLQVRDRESANRFQASTFVCSAKKRSIETFQFPNDPELTTVAACFQNQDPHDGHPRTTQDLTVLRYYPRKRLTFRTAQPGKHPASAIGKFVRSSNLEATYDKLVKSSQAVGRSRSSFSVAAPLGIDRTNGFFLQEERPGKPFADLVNKENFSELLYTVGAIHYELHRLDVPGLRKFDFQAFLRNVIIATEWISFFRPAERSFLSEIRGLLVTQAPRLHDSSFAFCHGDFSCLQVMKGQDDCSVVDFDDCMLGDPYLEIARLIAFLKYDVPVFRDYFADQQSTDDKLLEKACDAYAEGYQAQAQQALNQKRLLWYRICFEIYYLARLFKRDLFQPFVFNRTIKIVKELSERLRLQGEEA